MQKSSLTHGCKTNDEDTAFHDLPYLSMDGHSVVLRLDGEGEFINEIIK